MKNITPETILLTNAKGKTLAGSLWQAPSTRLLIMAHGSGSNRFAHGLFTTIAQVVQQEGINVFSFDFSGHGQSDDEVSTLETAVADLHTALEWAKKNGFTNIALLGHSLGAFACVANYSSDISTMILLGALVGPVRWHWQNICSPEQLAQMEKTGYVSADVNDGLRKTVRIDANIFRDIAAIDQQQLLKGINCPVLIIHGDADQQERDLYAWSQQALAFLTKDSQLQVIHGAHHNFLKNAQEVAERVKQWLIQHTV